jgi:hypothetical protein
MPARKTVRVVDSLALLVSIERGLAERPGVDPKVKAVLTANAEHASRFVQRLTAPTTTEYRDFLQAVAKRPKRDSVRRFLLGQDGSYCVKSPAFLRLMLRIATQFAEFQGDKL